MIRRLPAKRDDASWLDVPSPWRGCAARLRVRCREGESRAEALRDIGAGESGRPYLLENDSIRELHFTRFVTQSVMRIDDPVELVAPYTRKMMAFLLFVPRPRRILMLGLGGGSLAKFCHRHLSSCAITAVEPNPDVIALREEFHLPHDEARLKIVQADGAAFVADSTDEYDVILVDAFDRLGIAPSLCSAEFHRNLASRLSSHGVLVMNLVGDAPAVAAHAALARDLPNVRKVIVPMEEEGNTLIFGLRRPELQSIPDGLESAARRLQRALDLDFPHYLRRIIAGTHREYP